MEIKDIYKAKKDPFVDVIMTNYNKGQYIEEAISSVVNQEFKNWNLIIIDNFSQDNSKKILDKFGTSIHNVNIIFLSKNKGVSFSRNLGMRLSKSKYISFMDADDYWSSKKLKDQINFMEKFKHDFTYTDYVPFISNEDEKIFKKSVIVRDSFNFKQFINDTSIATSSMIITREIVGNIKYPKIKSLEDYCFKCKILKKVDNAVKFDQKTMFYRITKKSLSSNKLSNLYWLWKINKSYNKLNVLENLKSLLLVSLSSIRRYGFK